MAQRTHTAVPMKARNEGKNCDFSGPCCWPSNGRMVNCVLPHTQFTLVAFPLSFPGMLRYLLVSLSALHNSLFCSTLLKRRPRAFFLGPLGHTQESRLVLPLVRPPTPHKWRKYSTQEGEFPPALPPLSVFLTLIRRV